MRAAKQVLVAASFIALCMQPLAAAAQEPGLNEKAQELSAEVRDLGSELRPLYQDAASVEDQDQHPRSQHTRRREEPTPREPATQPSPTPENATP